MFSREGLNPLRKSFDEAPLSEVRVLGSNGKTVLPAVIPDLLVRRSEKPDVSGVHAGRILGKKRLHQLGAEVLIEKELHATEFDRRRSRAAANARQARMSSRDRSGKSARISSSVIAPARYSKTS